MQFNWIYIALVGVIILAIFINIASGVRKSSKTQLEIDAINYFDEIFTSVQASENTENSITLPGLELEVKTDRDSCNSYTISGSNLGGRSTEFTPLFSPEIIKKRILSYSLGWDMPFRVNYFLYLTSPDVAYVSVGKNEIELPEHITYEEINDVEEYTNENYYMVKFFSFSKDPRKYFLDRSVTELGNNKVSALYIDEGKKSIVFYEKDRDELIKAGETFYFDETTLKAAIYSENLGSYECNMLKAIKRLNKFSIILRQRIDLIKESDLMPLCSKSYYEQADRLLMDLEAASKTEKLTKEIVDKISSIKQQLQKLNTDINKRSCPTVY